MALTPANIQKGTTALNTLATVANAVGALGNLVLVSPATTLGYQPLSLPDSTGKTSPQGHSLIFHYEGENVAAIESDITDHPIETNSSIQDHVGLKPETITVHGFIGELNDVPPPGLDFLHMATQTLVPIGAFNPQLSVTAQEKYNEALYAYQTVANAANAAVGAFGLITQANNSPIAGSDGIYKVGLGTQQNLQQRTYQQLYGYWYNRTLFNIQTPWAIFTNMAIKTMRAIQDAETSMITDFEITFKKVRYAMTASVLGGLAKLGDGRSGIASTLSQNNGTTSGTPGFDLGHAISSNSAFG